VVVGASCETEVVGAGGKAATKVVDVVLAGTVVVDVVVVVDVGGCAGLDVVVVVGGTVVVDVVVVVNVGGGGAATVVVVVGGTVVVDVVVGGNVVVDVVEVVVGGSVVVDVVDVVVGGSVVVEVVDVVEVVVGGSVVVEVVVLVVVLVVVVVTVPQANQWLIAGSCPLLVSGATRFVHGGDAGSPRCPGSYRFVSSPPLTKIEVTVKPASTAVMVRNWPLLEIENVIADSGITCPPVWQSPGATFPVMKVARGSLGLPKAWAEVTAAPSPTNMLASANTASTTALTKAPRTCPLVVMATCLPCQA
jgi:hypothetical protein